MPLSHDPLRTVQDRIALRMAEKLRLISVAKKKNKEQRKKHDLEWSGRSTLSNRDRESPASIALLARI